MMVAAREKAADKAKAVAKESELASKAKGVLTIAISIDKQRSEQSPKDGDVHIMPVQGNIYMLVADGTNITVSAGPEGLLVEFQGLRGIPCC